MTGRRTLAALAAASCIAVIGASSAFAQSSSYDYGTGAAVAWANGFDGSGQTIAVIDIGTDSTEDWFHGQIVDEVCFSQPAASPAIGRDMSLCPNEQTTQTGSGAASARHPLLTDDMMMDFHFWHGSWVSGIAAGYKGDGTTERGIAPQAEIVAATIGHIGTRQNRDKISTFPVVTGAEFEQALLWVLEKKKTANIAALNISLNFDSAGTFAGACTTKSLPASWRRSATLIDQIVAGGTSVVVAAGNQPITTTHMPACLASVISVGGLNSNGGLWKYSSRSEMIDVLAPATGITGPIMRDPAREDGTSAAAPMVAGAIALYRQQNPTATPKVIRKALEKTGSPITIVKKKIGNVQRPALRIDHLLGLEPDEPTGTVRKRCIRLKFQRFEPKTKLRAQVELVCNPATGPVGSILLTMDGPGVNARARFADISEQPSKYYDSETQLFSAPTVNVKSGESYRTCYFVYSTTDSIDPVANGCRHDDL